MCLEREGYKVYNVIEWNGFRNQFLSQQLSQILQEKILGSVICRWGFFDGLCFVEGGRVDFFEDFYVFLGSNSVWEYDGVGSEKKK